MTERFMTAAPETTQVLPARLEPDAIGAAQDTDRRHVALPLPREDQNRPMPRGDENLVVDRIDIKVFGSIQLAVRALNDPDRPLLAARCATIGENGLSKLLGNAELIMNGIVSDPMHGSA